MTMNQLSTASGQPYIKSWFGFFVGLISVAISVFALTQTVTIAGILGTLGFLCFWYPWSQMTHWNHSIKNFFKPDHHSMSKLCNALTLIAMVLLMSSVLIRFFN